MSLTIGCYTWDSKYLFATSEFMCLYYCASLLLVTYMIEAYRIYSNIQTAVMYCIYKFRCKILFVLIYA